METGKILNACEFYEKLLFKTYEQRNLLEHNATFQEKAIQKIILSLSEAVKLFREIMVESVRPNKHSSFKAILEALVNGELDNLFKPTK